MSKYDAAIRLLLVAAESLERKADAYRQGARVLAEREQTSSGEGDRQCHGHSPSRATTPEGGEETPAHSQKGGDANNAEHSSAGPHNTSPHAGHGDLHGEQSVDLRSKWTGARPEEMDISVPQ